MSTVPSSFALDTSKFSADAAALLAVIEKHLQGLSAQAVKPTLSPGDVAAQFSSEAPESASAMRTILGELDAKILPYLTHWQHPGFFAYYPAATSIPAILSELLIASLGSVGLQWSANPAATELECVVMDWIAKMLHASEDSPFLHTSRRGGGIIQNTAGEALAAIMVAARVQKHRSMAGGDVVSEASSEDLASIYCRDSSRLVVYMSDQTHFSGPKAVRVAGMRLHQIPAKLLADGNFGIAATDVLAAMERDRAAGLVPCAVQLNFGSTNTCGYDDIASFEGFTDKHGVWVHVDAAYAGAALILPEFRDRSLAIQRVAQSFNFNGSKWFLCGFDSAFLFVRDRRWLKAVFAAGGDYLAEVASEDIYNPEFKDWSVPLGRRFRSLRIWMVLRYFGVTGLQEFLRRAIQQADWLRAAIDASSAFTQFVTTDLGLVCLALRNPEPASMDRFLARLEALCAHGQKFLLYPSQLNGKRFLRIALGGVHTEMSHVEEFWRLCQQAAQDS